ncbi:MAG TPA: prephenate dehydrogenase/arogenate dehydrogenase family protein [Bryobacteraceae bacterium]|nr:prephenate dehydrogenase/arogenate dehydrogenase family protein [Bryobacteraceae bacterium]
MNTLAIAGVGLIGGSFGLALRKAGFKGRILGISSAATIRRAVRSGAIDEGVSIEEALRVCDVLYLAQPIGVILQTIERIGPLLTRDIFITDAGSTKRTIVARASAHIRRGQFVGGHPVAGKEVQGIGAADPDLFCNRPYILTPPSIDSLHTPLAGEFVRWLDRIGSDVVVMSPTSHDRALAFTSHLPQLVSTALAGVISSEFKDNEAPPPAGPGLRDMMRLAQSPFDIWEDILGTNADEVRHALQVYIDKLTDFRDNLTSSALVCDFTLAAQAASRFRGKPSPEVQARQRETDT